MNIFSFSGILTGSASLILGAFVYFRSQRRLASQIFALFTLAMAVWGFGGAWASLAKNAQAALLCWKITYIGIIFIPVFLYHFVYEFLELKKRKLLYLFYFYGVFFLILEWTSWDYLYFGINNIEFVSAALYWVYPPTTLFLFFVLAWYIIFGYSLYELRVALKRFAGLKQLQIKYFFAAMSIGFAGGSACFLPCFGIKLYPVLNFIVPLYLAIMAYAILAHRLMDINIVITRGLAYSALTAVISVAYIGLMASADKFFYGAPGYSPALAHALLFIVVLFALIYVLPQMKIRAIEITRRAIFRGKYDYQRELSQAIRKIPTIFNLNELGSYVLSKISDTMMVEKIALFVYDEAERAYSALSCLGFNQDALLRMKINENSALAGLLRDCNSPIIREELKKTPTVPEIAGELALQQLDALGAQMCIPLMIKDDLTGIVTLSYKRNGEMYLEEDLSILDTLASQVALTIEYIKAIDKISAEKRYVGLGKAAMRMAHDIRNPLVPLKTFLQILPDKYPEEFAQMAKIDQEFTGRFYESALEGVNRINLLVERTLHYARHPEPIFSQVGLGNLLDKVFDQEQVGLRQANVELQKQYCTDDSEIRADSEQLIELFSNLITNSVEAMDTAAVKRLSVKTQTLNHYVAIEVTDTGCGIPKDKVDSIFDPFITYKYKGSGLGLAIAKKIVDDHKGSIEVISEVEKGTTFRVLLPKKQWEG